LSNINFQRTYPISEEYECIKERVHLKLSKYSYCPNLITFNDLDRSVTFTSERLIPAASTKRIRVMFLFSNPHPHSIHQGMFLSPNTNGLENLFWPVMDKAGWLPIEAKKRNPKQLADICLHGKYAGPFELIFYCYYAFPTDYPEDIKRIFGKDYFTESIEPEAIKEFRKTLQETSVEAVVTFNKGIFNLAAHAPVEKYIKHLNAGELIQSQVQGSERAIPIFLTYPTGWRYHKQYMEFRVASLEKIKTAICGGKVPDGEHSNIVDS
jgi:hypothetical protein